MTGSGLLIRATTGSEIGAGPWLPQIAPCGSASPFPPAHLPRTTRVLALRREFDADPHGNAVDYVEVDGKRPVPD